MSEENELRQNYGILADMLVSKISRSMIILCAVLTIIDLIYTSASNAVYVVTTAIISMLLLFVPSIIYNVLEKHSLKLCIVALFSVSFATGLFYTALNSHLDILFTFPIILSCFYNKKTVVLVSGVSTGIFLFLAKTLRYLGLGPGESSINNFGQLFFRETLPQEIIVGFIAFAAYVISDRFQNLINQILLDTRRIEQKHHDINALIASSNRLIDAQKLQEREEFLPAVAKIIINLSHVETVHIFPFMVAMIKEDDSGWDVLNYGVYSLTDREDHVHVGFDGRTFSFKYKKAPEISENELYHQDVYGISFPFYDEENKLVGFAIFSIDVPIEVRESLISAHAMISKAISNCILNKKLFSTQEELCFNLAEVCEAKSAQTGQHVKRIAKYMEIFGNALGLDPLENKVVSVASMLHDVGKLDIPISILDKPGRLTDEEYEIIKSHTKVGYNMLKNCSGIIMQRAAMMALEHHERWDGKGYNHIKGEDIDYYSRYVAVADVFDALASKRSYKEAWSLEDVKNEIVRCSGTQFCPDAVDKFVENFDQFAKVRKQLPD